MHHSRLLLSACLLAGAVFGMARSASAQIPFQIVVQSASATQVVGNGSNVNVVASGVGQPVQLNVTITYVGTGSASISSGQLFGSSPFTLASTQAANLGPGQSALEIVSFLPTSGTQVTASLTVSYTQTVGNTSSSGSISLTFTGSCPSFIFGYTVQPQGNAVPVSNGSTLTFPPTQVGSTTTALLTIENTGSAGGTLNSLTLTGSAFTTQGLPLLPGTIGGGQALQIPVVYTPTAVETDTGTIQLVFPGQTVNLNIVGSGISSQLQFQVTVGTQTLTVNQNQVSLPDTVVGSTTTVSVTVTDNGNANAIVNGISLSGSGFQLVNAPPLPQTIIPAGSMNLTFAFTPPQAGIFTGYLTVGGATLTVTAKGLGPLYQYSYTTGSSTSLVSPNGSVFFATAQLGQSSSTTFTLTNTGTAAGIVSGIYIGEANSAFALTGLPAFPLTLAPNQSVSFGVTFTPASVASSSGTLHIDGTVFVLTGAGGTPPPFPNYSLTGPPGTLGPLQQPAISLSLASPYPLAVSGTLTMTVVPDGFSADPAIQFSTGGRTIAFSIPANTTAAVFASGSTSIKLQTGSTSGTITLTPSFQTASGAPLTPPALQNLQLVVPATPPLLIGAQVTATATGIALAISGVSNSQTLTQISFSFTAAAGFNLIGATVSEPVGSAATAWFESAAAQPFGGQFVATIPFLFTNSNTSATTPAVTAVTSVSITAANAQGTSAPLVVSLP